jgi:hypothetical protein
MLRKHPLSSFDKIMKDEGDYLSMVSKTEKTEFESYQMPVQPPQASKGVVSKEKANEKGVFQEQFVR